MIKFLKEMISGDSDMNIAEKESGVFMYPSLWEHIKLWRKPMEEVTIYFADRKIDVTLQCKIGEDGTTYIYSEKEGGRN